MAPLLAAHPGYAREQVDLAALAGHVQRQIGHGPSTLFVACGTGGFTAPSLEQYRQVVTTAVEVAASRLRLDPNATWTVGMSRRVATQTVDPTPGIAVASHVEMPLATNMCVVRDQLARLASHYARCGIRQRDDTACMRQVQPRGRGRCGDFGACRSVDVIGDPAFVERVLASDVDSALVLCWPLGSSAPVGMQAYVSALPPFGAWVENCTSTCGRWPRVVRPGWPSIIWG